MDVVSARNCCFQPAELDRALDTTADRRDAAGMIEEEQKGVSPLSSGEAQGAAPAPAAPVNKVHEWTAAAAIVVFLTLVLVGFVYFLRGASL